MYCPHCGIELSDDSAFCERCGSKIGGALVSEHIGRQRQNKQKTWLAFLSIVGFFTLISAVLTVVSGVSFFGADSQGERMGAGDSVISSELQENRLDTLQIISNNLQNGGYVTTNGEYIYYFDESGICCISAEDDTEIAHSDWKPLLPTNTWLYCYGNTLFWSNHTSFYYSDLELSTKTLIKDIHMSPVFSEPDGTVYSIANYRVLCMRPPESDEAFVIANIPVSGLYRYDSHIYILSNKRINSHENALYGLWRVELDGSSPVKLLNETPDKFLMFGNKAYYSINSELYVCNLDCTNVQQIPDIHLSGSYNISGDYLFFVDNQNVYQGDKNIYRAKTDGTDITLIAEGDCDNLHIIGDWLYYTRKSGTFSKSLCRVRFDGSENQVLIYEWSRQ